MPPITVIIDKSKGSLGASFDTDVGIIQRRSLTHDLLLMYSLIVKILFATISDVICSFPSILLYGFIFQAGCIIISRIQKGGWLDGTDLAEGHEVISVNGEACGGLSVGQVEQLFTSASGSVTVIADNPMDTQRRRAIQL